MKAKIFSLFIVAKKTGVVSCIQGCIQVTIRNVYVTRHGNMNTFKT